MSQSENFYQEDENHIETETVATTYKVLNPATCEKEGKGIYTSNSFINEAFSVQTYEVVLSTLEHDIVEHQAKEATCTEIGWHEYNTCRRCEYTTYVEIPKLGHEYESMITEPTCTEQGYTTYTCQCGDSYKDNYVNSIGHSYGEVEYYWNETYTENRRSDCTAAVFLL